MDVHHEATKNTKVGCSVRAGGMRFNPAKAIPDPGDGVVFSGDAKGAISDCHIAGNTAAGVRGAETILKPPMNADERR